MKKIALAIAAFGVFASPALTFAQASQAPLTRAQVRAELIQLEQAGYSPSSGADASYPADIEAAEAKVAAANDVRTASAAAGDMGGMPLAGSSASGSGHPATTPACVGPVSFCNPYFGG